jgi:predicted RNA binding protein YcfA (HicA-like mRNA interferase family)
MSRHGPMKPREVVKRLAADGWIVRRRGPGDHVQYVHPRKPGRVTVDMGSSDIPMGTLRSIFRMADWKW